MTDSYEVTFAWNLIMNFKKGKRQVVQKNAFQEEEEERHQDYSAASLQEPQNLDSASGLGQSDCHPNNSVNSFFSNLKQEQP